jgi:hypothetical protein
MPVGYPTMPVRVSAIHATPIKSLRLESLAEAELTETGVADDRRFLLVDANDRIITQREVGALATIGAHYDGRANRLVVTLPGGELVAGEPEYRERYATSFYGLRMAGRLVDGPWAEAVSGVAGRDLRLIWIDEGPSLGKDQVAVSLLGEESVAAFRRHCGLPDVSEPRRFRPTLLLRGGDPHEEDSWVGKRVQAGNAVLRVDRLDPRCSLTTRNPQTGERDMDTLRLLASYRPPGEDKQIYFGVYADVEAPGTVRLGDPVHPLTEDEP